MLIVSHLFDCFGIKEFIMFILEKFNGWDEIDVGQSYYYDVTFKNGFLETLQKTLAQQNETINLFNKTMTVNEIVELIKNAQTKQISESSSCDLFWKSDDGLFEIYIYKEHVDNGNVSESNVATIKVQINLTDEDKPYLYLV